MRFGNSSYVTTDGVDTEWHHVAVTWTKSFTSVNFQIYIDGNIEGSTIYGNTWTDPSNNLFIGSTYKATSNFEGYMDEFRVWNYAKNSTQINADMHNTVDPESLGLLCYYTFDNAYNTLFADSVSFIDQTANQSHAKCYNYSKTSWETSTAPFGDLGTSVRSEITTAIGTSGKSLNMLMSSTDTQFYYTGIYTTGNGEVQIHSETFPSHIEKRPNMIWGAYRFGNGINNPYADITIDYSNLNIADEAARLMKRTDAISEWEDVTASATQNTTNHTFTLDYQTTFCEYSIGDTIQASSAPKTVSVNDITFTSAIDSCLNATNTITFAQDGAPVILTSGSSTHAIAGQNIRFLPGFHAELGSYLNAYITTDGSFCESIQQPAPIVATPEQSVQISKSQQLPQIQEASMPLNTEILVYPNPNYGRFTLEVTHIKNRHLNYMVFNSTGSKVHSGIIRNEESKINLENIQKGVYFILVIGEDIKLNQKFIVK